MAGLWHLKRGQITENAKMRKLLSPTARHARILSPEPSSDPMDFPSRTKHIYTVSLAHVHSVLVILAGLVGTMRYTGN
jgi:hypothetical protein